MKRSTIFTLLLVSIIFGGTVVSAMRLDVQAGPPPTTGYLEVSQVSPMDGTRDVNPVDTSISVIFNRPVVPLSSLAEQESFPQPLRFSPDVEGSGEWVNTSVYVFTPEKPLAGGTTYRITVVEGLQDTTGNMLEHDYSWRFSTITPEVVWTNPSDQESLVSVEPFIQVEFNMPVDTRSAESSFHLIKGTHDLPGEFQINENNLVFTPTQQLQFDTQYQVRLDAGLQAAAGGELGMVQDYAFGFTTVPLPEILETRPKDGESHAPPYTDLTIHFNAPINPQTVMPHIVLDPKIDPTEVYTYYASWDNVFIVEFGALPSTDYQFEITPGIEDPYGNRIQGSNQVRFTTDPLSPDFRLRVPELIGMYDATQPARVLVSYVNVTQINFSLYRLDARMVTRPRWEWDEFEPDRSSLVRSWTESFESELNEKSHARVNLVEGGGTLEPGLYLVDASSPQVDDEDYYGWGRRHILVVSDVNLTLKSSPKETLVWATDLRDGAPLEGLNVTLFGEDADTASKSITTDETGVATFDLDREYNGDLVAYAVKPFAAVNSNWVRGTDTWDFGLPSANRWTEARVYVYTDRPIYRPGQTVDVKGVVRLEDDASYSLADLGTIPMRIRDPNYELVFNNELKVSENGTFTASLEMSEGWLLGWYSIEVEFLDENFGSSFQVAAYRAPEFEVTVTPEANETVAGTPIRAAVDVSYFFGGPVTQVPVEWNVLVESYVFKPPWGGNYRFGDFDDPWYCFDCWWQEPLPPTPIASGSGTTDQNGQLVIDLPGDLRDQDGQLLDGSTRLTIEATVTGQDNQVISGRESVVVHQGDLYVGLRTRQYLGQAGKPFSVDLVTLDWEGKRLAGQDLDVFIVRREWKNVYVETNEGSGVWEWEEEDIPIETIRETTNDNGEATVTFTPPQGGTYRIIAKATDDNGRVVRSSVFAWISGGDYVSWRRENNDRINLISDKSSYVPGETAEILIPSPFEGPHYALITTERGRILSHEVIQIQNNSFVYRLPIKPEDAPNVYVSVVLIKGSANGKELADYKVGLLSIDVSPQEQELHVAVSPGTQTVKPGERVDFKIQVTDAQDQPVQAELSLDVVDKAVLSLLPRTTNAIKEAFYSRRGLSVQTANTLAVSVHRMIEEMEEDLGLATSADEAMPAEAPMAEPTVAIEMSAELPAARESNKAGATAPPGVTLREQFADTAYWEPILETDEQGQASLSVALPDNLTTWVARAVAVNSATQVGEGINEVVATKPLLIRPITPRFLVAGDELVLSAAVSNNTDEPLTVDVSLSCLGLTLEDSASQSIVLAAGQETTVSWKASASDVPSVDLVFSAVSQDGVFSDASKPRLSTGPDGTLLVYRYAAPDVVGTAGVISDAGSATELVTLPPQYDERQGELNVRIDPSLSASIRDGLTYLEHYPYECTEQTVSRFLPNVLTYQATKELDVKDPELEELLPGLVENGLTRLYSQQHEDGGWGWWPDNESNLNITAYVVFALLKAREADFLVEPDVLERGLSFLEASITPERELTNQYKANRQAWALYVLAEAGRSPTAALEELFSVREKLSLYARAYLALALTIQTGDTDKVQTLLSDIDNARILSATGAHWEEEQRDWWAMNSDTRSTAIILDALVRLDPGNKLIPNVVRWLMIARQKGVWETTQETAWALIALTDWMVETGELEADYDYLVDLNGDRLVEAEVNADNVDQSKQVTINVSDLLREKANSLFFDRSEGPGQMYYTAHLNVFLPVEELEPVDRGIVVQRRYTMANCDDGPACPELREATVGDVIRVDVTIIAPNDLYYLVLEDMLPAGAEAIDTGLATTSLLAMDPELRRQPEAEFGYYPWYWRWWHWYSRSELRDEKVVLFADYLPKGTYEYSYTIRATTPGEFQVIPTLAYEFYFPEVFGRGEGRILYIGQSQ